MNSWATIFKRLLFVLGAALMTMGNTKCQSDTLITPEGPVANQLNAEKDKQIADLKKQVQEEKGQRDREKAEAAKAASSVKGIIKANEYQPNGLPTEAIKQEASVALTRLPPDDASETVKSLQRAVEMIEGERNKALAAYAEARKDAQAKQEVIQTKEKEIEQKNNEIISRDAIIAKLTEDAKLEKEKIVQQHKDYIAKKDKELEDYKKEVAAQERKWWINSTRIAGLGFIVIGVLAIVVLKALTEGVAMAAAGVLIGLISIFIDWLTAQWWFPWLCGAILLSILIAGGCVIYRAWKTKKLHTLLTATIQDHKDESETLGTDLSSKLEEHLKYRLGDKNSFWGRAQLKEVAALGLANPKFEKKDEP